MSREQAITQLNQAEALVARLGETVAQIDADDLSGLAQMHGWCEALAEMGKTSPEIVGADQLARLTELARKLEELILGEAADAAQAFTAITQKVAAITGGAGDTACNGDASVDTGDSDAKADDLSNSELAEKLAAVFDEMDTAGPADMSGISDETASISDATATLDSVDVPVEVSPPEMAAEPAPAAAIVSAAAIAPEATSPATDAPPPAPSYVSEPLKLDVKELEFLSSFVQEAREHIEAIEAAVLEVERTPGDSAHIDNLFRPFHTIKGMAGFLNLRDIGGLTHEAETLLDQARKGKRIITPGIIDLILSVVDILKAQTLSIGTWVANPSPEPVAQPPVAQVIDKLRAVVAGRLDLDTDRLQGGPAANASATLASVPTDKPGAGAASAGDEARPSQEAGGSGGPAKMAESIRIDTDKLDALIDIVGELVIAQTLVNMSSDVAACPKLAKDVTQVTKIVRDVQEMAMAMRMVPIGPTFHKMARLVRDVSRKAGKHVELTISGNDTELDKTVIQEIGDPLVHMVRNAVDHGIESPDVRKRLGKPEIGQVHLHAGHEGGNIIISIHDDGKGLDPAVLIAKAIEKGIVQPNEELTEQQAFQLVFAPGFSTASQVTDISGRGVGMDVVKRNIDQLRGRVEITSVKGQGTTFIVRLPLTLAIIDGMVIRLGGERFIIPTIAISQSLRPLPETITSVHHRGEVLNVRGTLIPLVQLGQLFGLTGRIDPCQAMVVIAHCEGRLIGLVVEELIGQQQVVIKTLGERFEMLEGISGAAILGDGRVGLILEMTGLGVAHEKFAGTGHADPRWSTAQAIGTEPSRDALSTEPADQPAEPATEEKAS